MRWLLVFPVSVTLLALEVLVETVRSGSDGLAERATFLVSVGVGATAGAAVGLSWVFRGQSRLHSLVTTAGLLAAVPTSLVVLAALPWVLPHPLTGFVGSFFPLVLCPFAAFDWFAPGS
ncbi:MAG: hypothetical protein MUC96_03855 [Myxococcaceae bacterium]|jgi:hypothetical protein|nr:hypothetical protein [Myxococcaceae bacterium]